MKRTLALASLAVLAAAAPLSAQIDLEFSSYPGASIVFDPTNVGSFEGSFEFVPESSPTYHFIVDEPSPYDGLFGTIIGSFDLDQLTANSATVHNTGTLVLADGSGNSISATFEWRDLVTLDSRIDFGFFGDTNPVGPTNITFSSTSIGGNPVINGLAGSVGYLGASFTGTNVTVAQLVDNGANVGNYAGTISLSLIPEPSTYAFAITLLTLGVVIVRRVRAKSIA